MSVFYSPSYRGFYDTTVHAKIPSDSISITNDEHKQLLSELALNKMIVIVNGKISTVDNTSLKISENCALERIWRDSELKRCDVEIFKLQDSDPNKFGTIEVWRTYRKLLRAWPENDNFPNKNCRPSAPDFKGKLSK